ncbi:MAG: hypothetical protein LBB38_01425 [Puniceicoccales bacterium]|nr:hypothetical protein [Puniceicoccales bacterium]
MSLRSVSDVELCSFIPPLNCDQQEEISECDDIAEAEANSHVRSAADAPHPRGGDFGSATCEGKWDFDDSFWQKLLGSGAALAGTAEYMEDGQVPCPFDVNNTMPSSFAEQLRHMVQSGETLPKSSNGRLRVICLNSVRHLPEKEFSIRLMELLADRGIDCCICDENSIKFIRQINPDFIINFWEHELARPSADIPSAAIVWSKDHRLNSTVSYDAIFYATDDADAIKKTAAARGKNPHILPFDLSVKKTEFYDGPKQRLFYASVNWDRRRGKLYVPLYKLLDATGYFDAYGPEGSWKGKVKNSYRGLITNRNDELLKTAQRAGVVLTLHSDGALNIGTQSSRVFEAAAASAVIISDRHPFIVKHFGDSVLYVDQNSGTGKMFQQIDGHMRWILANQEKAKELARRSHEIFIEKFVLDIEADKIAAKIGEIVAQKAVKAR